jgi:hypothetical protein
VVLELPERDIDLIMVKTTILAALVAFSSTLAFAGPVKRQAGEFDCSLLNASVRVK